MKFNKCTALECSVICCGAAYVFIMLMTSLLPKPISKDTQIVLSLKTKAEQKKYLILYDFRETTNWNEGEEDFKECSFKNCYVSGDMSRFSEASAIIFQDPKAELDEYTSFTHEFRQAQIWIYETKENPYYGRLLNRAVMFNWTATYAKQSEIWTPYGTEFYEKLEKSIVQKTYPDYSQTNFAKRKKALALWITSTCYTHSQRRDLVNEIRQHMKVDEFGECRDGNQAFLFDAEILKNISKYKFYLAFENTLCDEYITESPFKWALAQGLVPVVYGAKKGDYLERFPPNSFIFVDDFESPKKLADYLKLIDKDDTLYNKYFQWKKQRFYKKNVKETEDAMCQICRKLNLHENSVDMVNPKEFWTFENMCREPKEF